MRPFALALSTALLLACAGAAPERTLYLLRTAPADTTGRVESPVHVALGRISVAPYLDQDGIVVETEAGQVHAAREHRWAEPLDAGLRSLLRTGISRAVGYDVSADARDGERWDYAIDVSVDRMHGTMTGNALLDASYRVAPASGEAVAYRFSRSTTLARKGYGGLVEAEQRLALELADAIAGSLRELSQK